MQESTSYTVLIQLAAPLPQGAKVQVEIPSEVTDNFDSNIMKPILNTMDIASATSTKTSSSPVTIEMTNSMTSGFYLSKNAIMMLSITNLINPSSVATSSAFKVTTYDDTYIVESINTLTITPTAGALTSVTITPTDTKVYETTTYAFSLTSAHTVPANGQIIVVLPSEVTTTTSADCTGELTGKTATLDGTSLTCSRTTTQITIANPFSATLAASTAVGFTMGSITNAGSTAATSAFTLKTTDSSANSIDEETS